MTKIRLLSDLHLEFGPFEIPEMEDDPETVLVLAGDIGVGDTFEHWMRDVCSRFHSVVYVLGNHEFYGDTIEHIRQYWNYISSTIDNLYLLDDSATIINGIKFLGGTLWTNFNEGDWFAVQAAKEGMNDFQVIEMDDRHNFTPVYWRFLHNETVHFLKKELEDNPFDGPTVVVTHHLPSFQSCHPRFSKKLNPAFASDLEWMFQDYNIDAWFHGHTHDSYDYNIGVPFSDEVHGRIVCNPRGYHGVETNPSFDPHKTIEL